MRTRETSASIPPFLAASILLSAGCATIADDYRVPAGSDQGRGYTSVSGDVVVGRQARIGNAKTVSGSIEIGEQSRTGSLSSVAGRIRVGANSKVAGSIKTVAGDVEIAPGCTINGDVGTVAGRVVVTDSVVKGSVTLTDGKLEVVRSHITGAVRIEHTNDANAGIAEITIGPGSEVTELVVEKKAQAKVKIHRGAKVGSIQGVVPEYYD